MAKISRWYMRDQPYGVEVLLENVLDPSHAPFSHHGIVGKRNAIALFEMELVGENTLQVSFLW